MKLYLSSEGLGNHPEELNALVGTNRRAAVISNAMDLVDGPERDERDTREVAALSDLGFQAEPFDLRDYFKQPHALEGQLATYGLLWVRGGNTFVLRRAMAASGFDTAVHDLLAEGVVYGGYSAGSCVAGRTLKGLELCDDPDAVPPGYPADTIWDGLGLVDYSIAPHYESDHPESEKINEVVAYYQQHALPYASLRDGEVIVVNK